MEALKKHSDNAMKLQRVGLPQEQVDALSALTHSTVAVAVQPMVQRFDGLENSIEMVEKSMEARFAAVEKSMEVRFEAAEEANKARFAEVSTRLDVMAELIAENGRQISQLRSEIRADRKLLIFASMAMFSAAIAMVGMAARLFVQ